MVVLSPCRVLRQAESSDVRSFNFCDSNFGVRSHWHLLCSVWHFSWSQDRSQNVFVNGDSRRVAMCRNCCCERKTEHRTDTFHSARKWNEVVVILLKLSAVLQAGRRFRRFFLNIFVWFTLASLFGKTISWCYSGSEISPIRACTPLIVGSRRYSTLMRSFL